MPVVKQDALLELIKSLNKAEKRAVTLETQKFKPKNSHYSILFEQLKNKQTYEEAKLKAQLPAAIRNTLAVKKNQLYQFILNTISQLKPQKAEIEEQLRDKISHAKFLRKKKLYTQSEEILKKAAKEAQLHNAFTLLLDINFEQRTLIKEVYAGKSHREALIKAIREKDTILDKLKYALEAQDCYDQSLEIYRQSSNLEQQQVSALIKELPNLYFQETIWPQLSELAQLKLIQAQFFNQLSLKKLKDSFFHGKEILAWWDQNPKLKQIYFSRYTIDVQNLIALLIRMKDLKAALELISQLEPKVPENGIEEGFKINLTYQKFLIYLNIGDLKACQKLLHILEEGYKSKHLKTSVQKQIIINLASYYFLVGHYQACVNWSDLLVNSKESSNVRIIFFGIYFKLISLIELEEDELFKPFLRRVHRHFFKKNAYLSNQNVDIQFIEKLKKYFYAPLFERNAILKKLKEIIRPNPSEPAKLLAGSDEIEIWINAKLHRLPIQIYFQETYSRSINQK